MEVPLVGRKKMNLQQTRDVLSRFRAASTQREKLKVINSVKSHYPCVAAKLHALATEKFK